MAQLTIQTIARTGLEAAYVAAAALGDEFLNNHRTFLHIKNGGGASIDVTFAVQDTVDGLAVTARTVAVPGGEERMIGPFGPEYDDAHTNVKVTYSDVTTVTVAAISLG